ncbi:MAG: hypothetical protein ACI8T1_003733 [Verrucomicrobiales bacterium]|jgi:DNA-binding transcriptional ArsR family regulator
MFSKILAFFSRKGKKQKEAPEPEGARVISAVEELVFVPPASATAEELCELRSGMTHEEMRAHLAKLYRRHNRAASSLNPDLRVQAERMLDAIVEVRHRYLDLAGED